MLHVYLVWSLTHSISRKSCSRSPHGLVKKDFHLTPPKTPSCVCYGVSFRAQEADWAVWHKTWTLSGHNTCQKWQRYIINRQITTGIRTHQKSQRKWRADWLGFYLCLSVRYANPWSRSEYLQSTKMFWLRRYKTKMISSRTSCDMWYPFKVVLAAHWLQITVYTEIK